jgi:hypothetical protein
MSFLKRDRIQRIQVAKKKYIAVVFVYVFLLVYVLGLCMSGIALRWSEGAIWATIPAAVLALYMSYTQWEQYNLYLDQLDEPTGKSTSVVGIHDVLYHHIRRMVKVGGGLVLLYGLLYGFLAYQEDIVPEMLGGGLMLLWLGAFGYVWYEEPVFDLESVVLARQANRLV